MAEISPVRCAVIGAGNVAQAAVLPAFAHAKRSKLVAVISGDPEKRESLSEKYDLDLHGDYSELEYVLREGAIDAVYIATPNALHGTFAKRAAALGVNVLCEKPLATSVAECESITTACAQAHVKLMVGYRLHFEATTLKALELVRLGKVGEPRVFSSVFGHVVRPGGIRDRPELGGGALLDLGVYCVNAARNLFGSEPELVLGASEYRGGVDDTTAALLQFPEGRFAQFTVSNDIAHVSSYRIAGTEGDLRVEPAYTSGEKLRFFLSVNGNTHSESLPERDQFAVELDYFSQCIAENLQPEPDGEEGILDARVLEAIAQSAASRKPVTLEPRVRSRHPKIEEQAPDLGIEERDTIKAPPPSVR